MISWDDSGFLSWYRSGVWLPSSLPIRSSSDFASRLVLSSLLRFSLVFSPPLILNFSSSFLTPLPSPPCRFLTPFPLLQLVPARLLLLLSSSPVLTYPLLPRHCRLSSPWISPPPTSDSFHFSPRDIPSSWFPQHHIPSLPFRASPLLPLCLSSLHCSEAVVNFFRVFQSFCTWRTMDSEEVGWGWGEDRTRRRSEREKIPLFLSHQGKIRVDISLSEAEKCSFLLLFS